MDSAAVVLMLKGRGYSVTGLYIDMLGCSVQRNEAVMLCQRMGVELHVYDAVAEFSERVIEPVVKAHNLGQTPSPCTICNPSVKFSALLETAKRLGIERIATGHYINIECIGGWYFVGRGADPVKDQSYYLWGLGQEVLSALETPLGGLHKSAVREYLQGQGYTHTAQKQESQGVCFAGGASGGYGAFLERSVDLKAGNVLDTNGNIVGQHGGYQLYTIGQRRGFTHSTGGQQRLEVRGINPSENSITIGEPLCARSLILGEWWYAPFDTDSPQTVMVRGLGRNPTGSVSVTELDGGELRITLHPSDIAWAPTVGQPCVVYSDGLVIGGGILVGFCQ